eukprot:scaffold7099_cov131-Isochrysis_galbana.AAC.7
MCWVRLRFPEGLRSARSMAAGSFASTARRSHQAVAVCRLAGRLQLRIALATEGPPGFARSRGGAARHLKQSGCCGDVQN